MSQQINLILPELRPRFDWLALPVVLAVALAGLLVLLGLGGLAASKADRLAAQEAQASARFNTLQQQVKEMGVALGARQGDTSLPQRIEFMRLSVEQRQEALKAIGRGGDTDRVAFAESMRGFSRQVLEGVWLTEFSLGAQHIEIRGRLTSPALLSAYIKRLNGESAFAGRRFEALEMKGEVPGEAAPGVADKAEAKPLRPFTEFVLRSEAAPKEGAR